VLNAAVVQQIGWWELSGVFFFFLLLVSGLLQPDSPMLSLRCWTFGKRNTEWGEEKAFWPFCTFMAEIVTRPPDYFVTSCYGLDAYSSGVVMGMFMCLE
jgi:hypothetical protein